MMKKYLLKTIAVVACLQGLAWTWAEQKQPTLTDLVARMSVEQAQKLPHSWAAAPISKLVVRPTILQFTVRNIPLKIEWIGEDARYIRLNGMIFTKRNLRTHHEFVRSFYAKFGIYRKRSSASLFSDATAASPESEGASERGGSEQGRIRFESLENGGIAQYFIPQDTLDNIMPEGSIIPDSQAGPEFRMALNSLNKDVPGLIGATAVTLGAFSKNMQSMSGVNLGPDGMTPGMRPSCVPSPYWELPEHCQ